MHIRKTAPGMFVSPALPISRHDVIVFEFSSPLSQDERSLKPLETNFGPPPRKFRA